MKRNIVSIQSQVATGYVGNNIAAFAIQLHGFDPVQVPTVILSNHVEYPEFYGGPVAPGLFSDLLKGIRANHIIEKCNYLISGFCNDKALISALAGFIKDTRTKSGYQYVYDPVCGDFRAGGLYLPKEIADYSISQLLPLSDIITPNHFELEYILSGRARTEKQLHDAIAGHELLHSKTVIVTSVEFENTPADVIEVVLFKDGIIERFVTPRVPIEVIGTGDLFTAIVTAQLNIGKDVHQAIHKAMAFLNATLAYTHEQHYTDLNAGTMMRYAHLLS